MNVYLSERRVDLGYEQTQQVVLKYVNKKDYLFIKQNIIEINILFVRKVFASVGYYYNRIKAFKYSKGCLQCREQSIT